MSVIKLALICGYLLSGFLIQGMADDGVSYDLEKIVTLRGKTYRDILIMDSDKQGLFFRHRNGVAKLSFSELSAGLRGMYQLTDDEFSAEETPLEEPLESGSLIDDDLIDSELEVMSQTLVNTRQSIYSNSTYYCPPAYWPRHWSQHQSAHNLVNPYWRAAVLQDFLYTTGLVPRPPGVFVHRLR